MYPDYVKLRNRRRVDPSATTGVDHPGRVDPLCRVDITRHFGISLHSQGGLRSRDAKWGAVCALILLLWGACHDRIASDRDMLTAAAPWLLAQWLTEPDFLIFCRYSRGRYGRGTLREHYRRADSQDARSLLRLCDSWYRRT